ncbi:MAG: hypothetical protein KDD70_07245 [Bdellovibrionales bacterium]|nr:hypothetical protein [Bdellovibrionales bacterium]
MNKRYNDEKGLTLLEYAAGAAFVLVIAAGAFAIFDNSMDTFFTSLGNNVENLNTGGNATIVTQNDPTAP